MNIMLRRAMEGLEMKLIQRNLFDPKNVVSWGRKKNISRGGHYYFFSLFLILKNILRKIQVVGTSFWENFKNNSEIKNYIQGMSTQFIKKKLAIFK